MTGIFEPDGSRLKKKKKKETQENIFFVIYFLFLSIQKNFLSSDISSEF